MPLYEYFCPHCENTSEHVYKTSERPNTAECQHCSATDAEYRVGKPAMFRVKFDSGGRVGFKYDMGNGKTQFRSATRENYEHNLGNRSTKDLKEMGNDRNKSVYTKEYDRHVRTKEKETLDKANKELKSVLKKTT